MGKRGAKTQPTALKILRGNPGRRPLPADEPKPRSIGLPDPPTWLGEVGVEKWRSLGPELLSVGCLTALDLDAFAAYCEAWDEFHEMQELIKKVGQVSISEKGAEYQHPAVGIKNQALQRIKTFAVEFGMTPSSRTGIKRNSAPETKLSKYVK